MLDTPKMKQIYRKIQKQLFYMIPEKWDRIFLYASVMENVNSVEVGEMYFYYYPRGVLKKNPVNVYEISSKFNIDDEEYTKLVDNLYILIKELRNEYYFENLKQWSNITITILKNKFTIEYNFDDLVHSKYSNVDRHIIWQEKYLDLPIERLNKKEIQMVEEYFKEFKDKINKNNVYEEPIYKVAVNNIIEYDREDEIKDRMAEARTISMIELEEEQQISLTDEDKDEIRRMEKLDKDRRQVEIKKRTPNENVKKNSIDAINKKRLENQKMNNKVQRRSEPKIANKVFDDEDEFIKSLEIKAVNRKISDNKNSKNKRN